MSDDDPHVTRTIRTPTAVTTITGNLSQVDELYRLYTHSLLDTGKYTIPKPEENPWEVYGSVPVDDTDHLRREVVRLTAALEASTDRQAIQELRSQLREQTLRAQEWVQVFQDQTAMVTSAISSLKDDPNPNLYTHVALQFLE